MIDSRPRYLYWLRLKSHQDIFSQGYVGVSVDVKERVRQHFKNAIGDYHSDKILSEAIKKHGKDNIQVDIVLCSSKDYCHDVEKKLRPKKCTGWNATEGGYHTKNIFPKGSTMPSWIVEKAQKSLKTIRDSGVSVGRDRKVVVNGVVFPTIKKARESCGISKTQMTRILRGEAYKMGSSYGNTKFSNLEIAYAFAEKK